MDDKPGHINIISMTKNQILPCRIIEMCEESKGNLDVDYASDINVLIVCRTLLWGAAKASGF